MYRLCASIYELLICLLLVGIGLWKLTASVRFVVVLLQHSISLPSVMNQIGTSTNSELKAALSRTSSCSFFVLVF